MIQRELSGKLKALAGKFPFVLISGPRQSGKSTLAKISFPEYKYISFSDIDMRNFAKEDPRGFIATYPDHIIIDEIQKEPSILSYLQTYTDNENREGMYILSGSQNLQLISCADESLAGRIGILRLLPLSHKELSDGGIAPKTVWDELFTGGYPRIYDKGIDAIDYYPNYISTYVERDIRNLRQVGDLSLFSKLLKLCAGRIGQLLNVASLATDCGISAPTAQAWLSILEQCYIIHLLRPDYNNFSKRLVKSPKLYFCDTGLACSLLEIHNAAEVRSHYLRGGLFENLVVNEILKKKFNQGQVADFSFWRDSNGNEVDLLCPENGKVHAYEIKSGATFNQDFFKGLDYWSKLSGAENDQKTVVYNGNIPMVTSHGNVVPWSEL